MKSYTTYDDVPLELSTKTCWRELGYRLIKDAVPTAFVWGLYGKKRFLYDESQVREIDRQLSAKIKAGIKRAKIKAKEEAIQAKEEAIQAKEEAIQAKEEAIQAREEAIKNLVANNDYPDYIKKYLPEHAETIYILSKELIDITEAHPDWLDDAIHAFEYSMTNNGIMSRLDEYDEYGCPVVDETFYSALCMAISAYRRHNRTDYDMLIEDLAEMEDWDNMSYEERIATADQLRETARGMIA